MQAYRTTARPASTDSSGRVRTAPPPMHATITAITSMTMPSTAVRLPGGAVSALSPIVAHARPKISMAVASPASRAAYPMRPARTCSGAEKHSSTSASARVCPSGIHCSSSAVQRIVPTPNA